MWRFYTFLYQIYTWTKYFWVFDCWLYKTNDIMTSHWALGDSVIDKIVSALVSWHWNQDAVIEKAPCIGHTVHWGEKYSDRKRSLIRRGKMWPGWGGAGMRARSQVGSWKEACVSWLNRCGASCQEKLHIWNNISANGNGLEQTACYCYWRTDESSYTRLDRNMHTVSYVWINWVSTVHIWQHPSNCLWLCK